MPNKIVWTKINKKPKPKENDVLIGMFPMPFHNQYSDLDLNMWEANTNFNVSHQLLSEICEVPGVEAVRRRTRYKFQIGVAKLFDEDEVKLAVQNSCGCLGREQLIGTLAEDTQEFVKKAIDVLKDYPFWFVFVFPDGKSHTYKSKSEVQYRKELRKFREVQSNISGTLIECD